ncbi:MAG: hypothetical protein OXE57_05570 [Alphaproteobacteria bacterium]|nr:hypothetical protein [Alphaproteobacteria bacterium]
MRFGWMVAAGIAAGIGGMTGMAEAQAPRPGDVWPEQAVPEEEAATAGRRVMPLTQQDIRLLGELVRQQQRATREGAGFRPSGRIRRVAVDPGAGAEVPAVEVRQGFTTVLSWTDTTGSPWPVEEVLVDSQFLPGEGGEEGGAGHLVYLAPKRRFLAGNLVVKLRGLAEPLVVLLQDSGGPESDFRVEMRLARPGPGVDAAALMRPASFHAGDGELAGLLAGAIPDGAVRVELIGGDAGDRAWRQGEDLLLLSRHVVLSPGPWAAERGSGGRWAYRLPAAPELWVSLDGRERRVSVREGGPSIWAGASEGGGR